MGSLDAFFPYPSYRPYQREMLEMVGQIARDGRIALIDAPTGSGKSSVVASLLSEANGRRVIIAVRTVSQLSTFIRELELIREKQPHLKYAYLMGKASLCPIGGEGDIYRRCEVLKTLSLNLMRDRAARGSLIPSRDPLIRRQIQKMSRDRPFLCPYYIRTRIFLEEDGLRMVPSSPLRRKAESLGDRWVAPQELAAFCEDLCPYETMIQAARGADVVILNFHHLFDEAIREQTYTLLGVDPASVLLLIDEAHNCGDALQSVQSVELEEATLDQAAQELAQERKRSRNVDALRVLLPEIRGFIELLKGSREDEDWFDPAIFCRMILRGSLYQGMEEMVEDLLTLSESMREVNMKAGEFRVSGIERLALFLYKIHQSSSDPAYLTVYRKEGESILLEVRSIDPGPSLSELAQAHACCVFISGTLSPVEGYRMFYFGNLPVTTLTLPNAFPPTNRRILCTGDITTAYRRRQDPVNVHRIRRYILEFSRLPGNLAIYFPSYQVLESFAIPPVLDSLQRRFFIEPRDSTDAQGALRMFLSLPSRGESGILLGVCGGKWSEGLDYRGEMLSAAIVIGLPLAPYNRVRQMIIQYFRSKFGEEGEFLSYTLPAINRALQALGRVLRTPEDRGVLVLGDQRFLEPRIKRALPIWMQEELIPCDSETFSSLLEGWR